MWIAHFRQHTYPSLLPAAYVQQYNDPPVYNLVSICGVQVCVYLL